VVVDKDVAIQPAVPIVTGIHEIETTTTTEVIVHNQLPKATSRVALQI
jgi:hypothetical protein